MTMTDTVMPAPLFPLAKQLNKPEKEYDTEEVTYWFNPTRDQVILPLFVGVPMPGPRFDAHGNKRKLTEYERTGIAKFVVEPGETKGIRSVFDNGIQQAQCYHDDCLRNPFGCKSTAEGHEKVIVGGYGPQLINKGRQRYPVREGFYTLHPALNDVDASKRAALQAKIDEMILQQQAEDKAAEAKAAVTDAANREQSKTANEAKGQPTKAKT